MNPDVCAAHHVDITQRLLNTGLDADRVAELMKGSDVATPDEPQDPDM